MQFKEPETQIQYGCNVEAKVLTYKIYTQAKMLPFKTNFESSKVAAEHDKC